MRDKELNKSIEAYKSVDYEKAYEREHFLYNNIRPFLNNTAIRLLDIGCGSSRFLYYLRKKHPEITLYGLEYSKELIDQARQVRLLKDVVLIQGDARSFSIDIEFDIVLMSGVLSIFDDIDLPVKNMMKHLKKGGAGFIFGTFCEKDIDVIVRYRNNYLKNSEWESGLNMFSLDTMKRTLRAYAKDIEIFKFEIPIDLNPDNNPIRSFTIKTSEGKRIISTGANIINDFYTFKFIKT